MNAHDTPDQRAIREHMAALTDLLLRKNRDYGSSFRAPGTLSAADPADKLIIRIEDKLSRFKTLYGARSQDVASESLTDTINDIAGYFVLLGILIAENTPQSATSAPVPHASLIGQFISDYTGAQTPPAISTIQNESGETP
jgi:hypothetical protein